MRGASVFFRKPENFSWLPSTTPDIFSPPRLHHVLGIIFMPPFRRRQKNLCPLPHQKTPVPSHNFWPFSKTTKFSPAEIFDEKKSKIRNPRPVTQESIFSWKYEAFQKFECGQKTQYRVQKLHDYSLKIHAFFRQKLATPFVEKVAASSAKNLHSRFQKNRASLGEWT